MRLRQGRDAVAKLPKDRNRRYDFYATLSLVYYYQTNTSNYLYNSLVLKKFLDEALLAFLACEEQTTSDEKLTYHGRSSR